ncbi:MAG: leucine--tRNA ligase [Bacteroidetes bacterium]|nr:leucine--tRNA ligase [Bacteroidota bacterium]MDA1121240.1 leucine--tRNA ligase [Bacteroidota bacterium]
MAEYPFQEIEKKWQQRWKKDRTFLTKEDTSKPKYYVLDMFPYPSGAGLHVGHPLGYIATDIVSRYKRLKGFNVLHPMGFDSFGLPAEQYAIKTGQHPADTTAFNIARFKEQLEVLGFSYDWEKEVWTSNPDYYRWSQWIFLKLFQKGLAYEDEALINWCSNDKTVLANEEVKNGMCDRCGQPVIRRKLRQWILKITEYADRLLEDLDGLDWPESIKLSQVNWIGKSHGADIVFKEKATGEEIKVYTTRPDTIFGVTYMVIAPEHGLVDKITTSEQRGAVDEYVTNASLKSDLERTELDKTKTGVFTGAYAVNPINGEEIPVWISDYVLISYGTGAIMAVPGGDQRDFEFAKKFNIPIIQVITPDGKDIEDQQEAFPGHGLMLNSGEYNGMDSKEFTKIIIDRIEKELKGKGAVNYKLRDWIFTRQRYWGEPIPVIHCGDCGVVPVPEDQLPVLLPNVESYTPTDEGDSPLAKVEDWVNTTCPKCGKPAKRETNTMPQWAGSCWYYLRFIDPKNTDRFVDKDKEKYWMPVDLYVGGAEHAVLHLLYARFWHKVLFDLGYVSTKEPFQKLVNQGMIQGRSNFVYRVKGENKFVSYGLKENYDVSTHHVDVSIVANDILDVDVFKKSRKDGSDAEFILENGKYICGWEVEKMSKSKYNVVNPDAIIEKYGADTMRMYEMFLGPLEQFKPWNTQGIDGVFKFLRRFWNLFHKDDGTLDISEEEPTDDEMRILHKTIKKAAYDVDNLSFNTSVSAFMICVNELMALKCNKLKILESLTLIISPYAPHICEELWEKLGNTSGISFESFPTHDEKYLQDDSYEYPISINGKMRAKMTFAMDMPREDIEKQVLASEIVLKWTEGKPPKKVIVVPKKIVNIVV